MLRRRVAPWLLVLGLAISPGQIGAGSLDLRWDGPTTNADGSPLTDLRGYRVYRHTSPPTCSGTGFQFVPAGDPSPETPEAAAARVTGLEAGVTYWVRVSAVDLGGQEGECAPAVSGVAQLDGEVTLVSLDFGSVSLGASGVLDLTVENVGGASLTVAATTAAPFSIVAPSSPGAGPPWVRCAARSPGSSTTTERVPAQKNS